MRTYTELVSSEPAWPDLEASARASGRVTILPRNSDSARACLERLQVSARSTLGALAHETGGLLIDHGWIRMFGSGHPQLSRVLGEWNKQIGVPLADFVVVADDVVGGAFAVNGGALGSDLGNVFYFAPDTLAWEDTGHRHSAFVQWTFEGDLALFYEHMRWPGWAIEIKSVSGDQTLSLYPPPWTREGRDVSRVSRRPVPVSEVWGLEQELAQKLAPPSAR